MNVDELIDTLRLEPDGVWRKGEDSSRGDPLGEPLAKSVVTFVASDADFEAFETQLEEATAFVERNMAGLIRVSALQGVEEAVLDFGVELRDVAVHCDRLPPRFLRAAGKAGVSVQISHYSYGPEE